MYQLLYDSKLLDLARLDLGELGPRRISRILLGRAFPRITTYALSHYST